MGYYFHFSRWYPATYVHWILYVLAYLDLYLNFKAVLALPKTDRSAKTHKSISFIWIVWSTLYVYLFHYCDFYEWELQN